MFHAPDHYRNVSLRLSEILNDIGVSETMLVKGRRAHLLRETAVTIKDRLHGDPISTYYLGSRSEGTTTAALNSDSDVVFCNNAFNVMQDWSEWSHGKLNLLMIQDDTCPPGYCYLQRIRPDFPLPETEELAPHYVKDTHGRVLMKNTWIDSMNLPGHQREGPSWALQPGAGFSDSDKVAAFPFKSLPQSFQHWLNQGNSRWFTAQIKRYAAISNCFVVPTGSVVSYNKVFQCRISTSLAERCFMLNLNITQIRCYILLKMILKTYINLHGQTHITSYMCKTVLFHCIRSKPLHVWKESNILNCLTYCLFILSQCILCCNCPHFIIHGNNLMAGKISAENKNQLLEQMSNLVKHTAVSLLGIQIDNLGQRLLLKLNIIHGADYDTFAIKNTALYLASVENLSVSTAFRIDRNYKQHLLELKNKSLETQIHFLLQSVTDLVGYHSEGNMFVQTACRLLTPFLCTTLGSLMASYNIQHNHHVSHQALGWMAAGINSDVLSSKLKLASVFYCTRDIDRTAFILRDTEERYNMQVVQPICQCYKYARFTAKIGFAIASTQYNEEAIKYLVAFCVKFLPSEINCIPKELQFELFRSTGEELLHREDDNAWMDLAAIDSIPYLYFLQYKTYGYQQRIQDQHQALNSLVMVTRYEEDLRHRETAWNLLGQCMEQENRPYDALQCYRNSLDVRPTNNVARFHICMLLARLLARARENN